ncbi:MAG: pyridoxal-phosphate dependent enzyme, partial [Pseudomonadota bacterium]
NEAHVFKHHHRATGRDTSSRNQVIVPGVGCHSARSVCPVFQWIVTATGSTGTHAGLVAGLHALGADMPVLGVSVRQPKDRQIAAVHALAQKTAEKLGAAEVPVDKILVDDGYIGPGYGVPAQSTLDAIEMTALTEGLLLDPVYSAKGMAGLIGLVREGFFKPTDNVLFLHTGGATALFAYQDLVLRNRA